MELKVAEAPIVGLQYLAYPLNVLLNYDEYRAWYYNNYIQILCNSAGWYSLRFFIGCNYEIPVLRCQALEKTTFVKMNCDIIRVIVDALNDGWYVTSNFDEYYLPNREAFKVKHFEHDFMIYGCNQQEESFSLLGYSNKGLFEKTKISFLSFEKAFYSQTYDENATFVLFKKRDNLIPEFDINVVKDFLYDYVYSQNTYERLRTLIRLDGPDDIFGMDTYQYLRNYYNDVAELKDEMGIHNIRDIHIFWEHKKCLLERIEYLYNKKILQNAECINRYKVIEREISNVRNFHMKYSITGEKYILTDIIAALNKTEQKEREILENVLKEI